MRRLDMSPPALREARVGAALRRMEKRTSEKGAA